MLPEQDLVPAGGLVMPGFNYANNGGFKYHTIDPNSYKFSKYPAFNRPPTPPEWTPPPKDPFAEEEEDGGGEKGEENAEEQGQEEEGQQVGIEPGESTAEDTGQFRSITFLSFHY